MHGIRNRCSLLCVCCCSYEPTPDDLVELQKHKYVSISPKEFVSQLFRQSRGAPSNTTRANAAKTKYFVLDCRSREQYDNECIVTSLNLPAELLSSGGDECNHVVDSLLAMSEQGCLLCFLDERPNRGLSTESETSESATRPHSVCAPTVTETIDQWISFLSQRGVRRCAVVDGGYIQCKHAVGVRSSASLSRWRCLTSAAVTCVGSETLEEFIPNHIRLVPKTNCGNCGLVLKEG